MIDFIIKNCPTTLAPMPDWRLLENGRAIRYEIAASRTENIAACYADPSLAAKILDWHATRGIDEMCADSWRWQQMNPNGFLNA